MEILNKINNNPIIQHIITTFKKNRIKTHLKTFKRNRNKNNISTPKDKKIRKKHAKKSGLISRNNSITTNKRGQITPKYSSKKDGYPCDICGTVFQKFSILHIYISIL